ncbi:MAG: cupin domain-containing protein [Candidatus Omnitrophota bacterium]|nr:cupin domain-containing protein [Candidatus Omnitrophota bacterium]
MKLIKKASEQEKEIRKNMRGGEGEVTIRHYFKKDEINASCRLCAQLVIPPGAGIGRHEHAGEDEIFIIQRGRALITCDDREEQVGPGDSILTGKGESHSIRNKGDEDLLITAVIMRY